MEELPELRPLTPFGLVSTQPMFIADVELTKVSSAKAFKLNRALCDLIHELSWEFIEIPWHRHGKVKDEAQCIPILRPQACWHRFRN